jgi:hypothetical protein
MLRQEVQGHDTQRSKYAPFSSHILSDCEQTPLRATDHTSPVPPSTSSAMTRFSRFFIAVDRILEKKKIQVMARAVS